MIQRLNARLRPRHDEGGEAGFTVVEVMVAMLVFAVISVGIAYGIANTLQLTQSNRGRATAVALASQDIDDLRQTAAASTTGIFNVVDSLGAQQQLGGVVYTIDRSVRWVQSDGASGACGTSTGKLAYKSVVETVSWPNPRGGQRLSATMTSAIAPSSAVTDPSYGTIIVSATDASGAPNPGVTISITPVAGGGGAALAAQPRPTDSQGCSYAINVQQGDYTVTASEPGGIDTSQAAVSQQTPLTVVAGASTPVPFVYDLASTMTVNYAQGLNAMMPTNMVTTLANGAGARSTFTNWTDAAATRVTSTSSLRMSVFPFTSGYFPYAGPYATGTSTSCLSPNAAAWTTPNAQGVLGKAPPVVATAPGKDADPKPANIQMGVATLKLSGGQPYVVAVSSGSPSPGDPGCSAGMTMTFPAAQNANSTVIALPFGTWKLYTSNTFGKTSGQGVNSKDFVASNANDIALNTPGTVNQSKFLGVITYDNTVTFDPRGQW